MAFLPGPKLDSVTTPQFHVPSSEVYAPRDNENESYDLPPPATPPVSEPPIPESYSSDIEGIFVRQKDEGMPADSLVMYSDTQSQDVVEFSGFFITSAVIFAIVRIQSRWRGSAARHNRRKRDVNTIIIQRWWRYYMTRRHRKRKFFKLHVPNYEENEGRVPLIKAMCYIHSLCYIRTLKYLYSRSLDN